MQAQMLAKFPSSSFLRQILRFALRIVVCSAFPLLPRLLWRWEVSGPLLYMRLTSLPLLSYCSLLLGTPFSTAGQLLEPRQWVSAWTESCHPDPGMYDIRQTEDHQVQNEASASLQALWVTDFQRFPLHPIRNRPSHLWNSCHTYPRRNPTACQAVGERNLWSDEKELLQRLS